MYASLIRTIQSLIILPIKVWYIATYLNYMHVSATNHMATKICCYTYNYAATVIVLPSKIKDKITASDVAMVL